MIRTTLFAACLSVTALSAYAEGPQEKALDNSMSPTDVQESSRSAPSTAPTGNGDDPSAVVSRPTQTEPAKEGPEEKALDKSLQNGGDPGMSPQK